MSDIIDNQQIKLLDSVRRALSSSSSTKMAVGYFFLSGFKAIAPELGRMNEVKLLIGNTTDRETIEQLAEGYKRLDLVSNRLDAMKHPRRAAIRDCISKTSQEIATSIELMDQTDDEERLVLALARMIEEGRVKVRVYTRGRLHAKAYIFDYGQIFDQRGIEIARTENGIAIVGSSNLSIAALTANTELNVLIHGNDNHRQLAEWFDKLWDESQDFDEQLIKELQQSWAMARTSPYDIYMKTLYELVKDRLDGDGKSEILWEDELIAKLADFQKVAVKQAIRIIRDHNGCFVSDVVGLGKSYIGAAIIKHFVKTEGAKPLIICPAPLVEMWQRYVDLYSLNAKVLSMGLLREDDGNGLNRMLGDDIYSDRDFILIDESHNFRYPDTQRYRVLQHYLSDTERKCCLLTATPRNKSVIDIYNQMNLFYRESGKLPIDPPSLKEYFKLVEDGERSLPDILSHVLIRRTRNHVLKWYGYDEETNEPVDSAGFKQYLDGNKRAYVYVAGRRQFFPGRRLETVTYSIENTYNGLYKKIREFLGKPYRSIYDVPDYELTYARFGLWHYVKESMKDEQKYKDLKQAGTNLSGLVRVLAFKRLESSVYAFQETVRRMIEIHKNFLEALGEEIIPAGDEAQQILYESDKLDQDELIEKLKKTSGKYDCNDFDMSMLMKHIEQDLRVLSEIHALVKPIGPQHDDKLKTLKERLTQKPLNTGKCLIFTQYADTAKYLYENLNPTGMREDIEVIYSGYKSKSDIVGRFAPISNPEHFSGEKPEIDLLIATDVLSEGLNLQDCNKIINYDLHWNPVRLIQRFGRIDRIGSEYNEIFGFNFLPEMNIEANLHLEERLQRRINEIHETIGEDAAILTPTEKINDKAMYAIYSGDSKALSELEDDEQEKLISLSEAEEMLRQLRKEKPEEFTRISELRNGIRSGIALENFEGYYVFCKSGDHKKMFLLDSNGNTVTTDVSTILGFISCDEGTPRIDPSANHNGTISRTFRNFRNKMEELRTRINHFTRRTSAQDYVSSELSRLFQNTDDEELKEHLAILRDAFTGKISIAVERLLKQLKRERVTGQPLFDRLVEIYTKYDIGKALDISERREAGEEIPTIVVSESLFDSRDT